VQGIFRRSVAAALVMAALLPVSAARADWWSDARLVKQGISRAVQVEWMTADDAANYRAILNRATSTWRQLPGSRSTNLAGVLHDVARQWQAYIAPRALTLFSMLDENTTYLGADAMPPDGADIRDADGVVYRAFSGHGLQFHPLANFARLNTLLARDRSGDAAWLAAALIARAVPRKGALTWEYYFPFDGGYPPWTSGMVQAVAARAFAEDGDYDVARKAYLALPRYVFPLAGGLWIRLYSFSNVAVLNAQLQSALSLADYAQLNQDPSAAELSTQLLGTADALFDRFDTGAWSLYSLDGPESPLNYHVFVTNLLKRIAAATQSPVWADRAERFDGYTSEPPVVVARAPARPIRKTFHVSYWISKISHVTVSIGGATSSYTAGRGSHGFTWSTRGRRKGRYALRITAVDLAGNKTVKTVSLLVRK
jgi:D-glucuronyl C5-epimerase C-terminus